jgi:hypothetical protein
LNLASIFFHHWPLCFRTCLDTGETRKMRKCHFCSLSKDLLTDATLGPWTIEWSTVRTLGSLALLQADQSSGLAMVQCHTFRLEDTTV